MNSVYFQVEQHLELYLNTFIFASTMNLEIFRDVLSMIDLLWMQLVVNLERDT